MKSLSIWYESKSQSNLSEAPELHLHFNHWKLRKSEWSWISENEYLLDVGLRISKGTNVEYVCIYLPQEINDVSTIIEDLGGSLKDQKLLTAVFNEKYDPRLFDGKKYIEVKREDNTLFYIYSLDVNSDIQSRVVFGGTIIKFPFHYMKDYDTYYRLRFKTDFVKQFSYNYRPKSSYLESIFSSIELIDFRINDTRNLNLSLLEHISTDGQMFNISLIHLFVMRNLNDEYILSDLKLNNVRQLEEETWGNYLSHNNENPKYTYNKVIAYHLKNKVAEQDKLKGKYIEDFSALLKFKYEDRILNWYFFYLILLGLGTAIVGNTLYETIKCLLSQNCSIASKILSLF